MREITFLKENVQHKDHYYIFEKDGLLLKIYLFYPKYSLSMKPEFHKYRMRKHIF